MMMHSDLYDLTDDRRWWPTLGFFRFIPVPSLSLSVRRSHFISAMTDSMRCTLSFITLPAALKAAFMYRSTHKHTLRHAGLYTERTENMCRPRCFFLAFVTVMSTHNSTAVETAGRWYSCVCTCVCETEREDSHYIKNSLSSS